MNLDYWNIILFGGGGLTGLASLILMKSRDRKQQEIDMIDRLQTEIKRLDDVVSQLRIVIIQKDLLIDTNRALIMEQDSETKELSFLVSRLELQISELKLNLDQYTVERGYVK